MIDRDGACTDDAIHFLLGSFVGSSIFEQIIPRKREQPRCCLVSSNKECDHVVNDAVILQ